LQRRDLHLTSKSVWAWEETLADWQAEGKQDLAEKEKLFNF